MILYKNQNECCGCSSCASICPQNAIQMQVNERGFKVPLIDSSKCTNCGICKKACAFQSGYLKNDQTNFPLSFAAKHKDDYVLRNCQSGGGFVAFSNYILDIGGVVYGVGFDSNLIPCHKRATTKEECKEFSFSKYVQSDIKSCFDEIKNDLTNNLLVLFTGTPCQVAGLIKYLKMKKISMEKLYTVDIICHGVPSPKVFSDYLEYISKKYKGVVDSFIFRNKKFGWKSHIETFEINGIEYSSRLYRNLFSSRLSLRSSCFNCKYTNMQRPSDITLGDYWHIEKTIPEFFDEKGCSLILVNSSKGNYLFNIVKAKFIIKQTPLETCLQGRLQRPCDEPIKYNEFWTDYLKHGFLYISKKYAHNNLRAKFKLLIKKYLYSFFKNKSVKK